MIIDWLVTGMKGEKLVIVNLITSVDHIIDVRLLSKGMIIRKGKKVFHKAVVK